MVLRTTEEITEDDAEPPNQIEEVSYFSIKVNDSETSSSEPNSLEGKIIGVLPKDEEDDTTDDPVADFTLGLNLTTSTTRTSEFNIDLTEEHIDLTEKQNRGYLVRKICF